jgi:RNA polymerase sigma-70 factor (ECF subfamily)
VLNLYVFEGKSHQEIATLLGIKKDSSASQFHKAKKMLAQMIRKYNNNTNPRR